MWETIVVFAAHVLGFILIYWRAYHRGHADCERQLFAFRDNIERQAVAVQAARMANREELERAERMRDEARSMMRAKVLREVCEMFGVDGGLGGQQHN